MPDNILTAPVFKRLSLQSRVAGFSQSSALANVISDLKNTSKSLVNIAIGAGMYTDANQAAHLDKDWLDSGGTGFWHTTRYKVADLVRAGMLQALQVYQSTGKPLEFYWMISGRGGTGDWNVLVVEATDNIIVIFFTPNVRCDVPTVEDTSMWVTEQDANDKVLTRHTQRPNE
jgi:hypothetical protein